MRRHTFFKMSGLALGEVRAIGESNVRGAFWRAPPKVENPRLVPAAENLAVEPELGATGFQFTTLAVAGGSVSVALPHTGKGIVVFGTKGGGYDYHPAPYANTPKGTLADEFMHGDVVAVLGGLPSDARVGSLRPDVFRIYTQMVKIDKSLKGQVVNLLDQGFGADKCAIGMLSILLGSAALPVIVITPAVNIDDLASELVGLAMVIEMGAVDMDNAAVPTAAPAPAIAPAVDEGQLSRTRLTVKEDAKIRDMGKSATEVKIMPPKKTWG